MQLCKSEFSINFRRHQYRTAVPSFVSEQSLLGKKKANLVCCLVSCLCDRLADRISGSSDRQGPDGEIHNFKIIWKVRKLEAVV
jgi:hypothetical protein